MLYIYLFNNCTFLAFDKSSTSLYINSYTIKFIKNIYIYFMNIFF